MLQICLLETFLWRDKALGEFLPIVAHIHTNLSNFSLGPANLVENFQNIAIYKMDNFLVIIQGQLDIITWN